MDRTVLVEAVVPEADGVCSLIVADPDGGPLPEWEPGAHIDVLTPVAERQYSLCGEVGDRARWRIGVLREPGGRGGSEWLHIAVRPGDRLRVRGPRNHFALVEARRYVFVAGGIGITPILPMVRAVAARGADWGLVYGGRSARSMAYVGELRRYGERVRLWPQDRDGLIDLGAALGLPEPGTVVYCCGPEPLLAAVEAYCADWPAGALHLERFHPREGALDGERTAFEIVLAYSELTLAVGADETIADVVEQAGIDVPTSCREGTCGTCETVVLDGEPDHRDSYLSDGERAEGDTMMICCSRARGPRLVLDL
jgi:ferredoxin-NADP reductase